MLWIAVIGQYGFFSDVLHLHAKRFRSNSICSNGKMSDGLIMTTNLLEDVKAIGLDDVDPGSVLSLSKSNVASSNCVSDCCVLREPGPRGLPEAEKKAL
ncbi:unnamed protein product [Strongylus vulgaris]|uniref:Uncharacterized protein n=1 Tax=Strongylus vulgaris TaxID=40348 RepID=A0A3P7LP01_STRVU|nr:unnamed protein product [Strongylus vulgaris]